MGFKLELIEPGIVAVTFCGVFGVDERFSALDEVNALRASGQPVVVMIDMSNADMRHYSAMHALALSEAVSRRRRPFAKVAYVLRPGQSDMVATTMAGLYGPELFRRFASRDEALEWLRAPRAELDDV
jgi:hypothetical protein